MDGLALCCVKMATEVLHKISVLGFDYRLSGPFLVAGVAGVVCVRS